MDKRRFFKILLVDDTPNVEEAVREGLERIGIKTDIEAHCPKRRVERFGGCTLPAGKQFDAFHLALIDLELFPIQNLMLLDKEDLRGGSEVLPYIRREAPWIPVIAYSQHFEKIVVPFLPIACGFGFDGYLPRGLFSSVTLTQALWDNIYELAKILRVAAAVGESANLSLPLGLDLRLTGSLAKELDAKFPMWRRVFSQLFCFCETATVTKLAGGWSGATVLQVYAHQRNETGGREGDWLVKLSESPSKLQREAQSHIRMIHGGLEFARSVQLLWPIVLVEDTTAGIAYQFARGTSEAAKYLLEDDSRLDDVCERLSKILAQLYNPGSVQRDILGNVLREWSPPAEELRKAAKLISVGEVAELLLEIAEPGIDKILTPSVGYQQSLIHGDLHLGNVMIGERDLLIDFARSNVGPIAVDVARVTADLLIRLPQLRPPTLPPSCLAAPTRFGAAVQSIVSGLRFENGDTILTDYFLRVFIAQHLNYRDISPETKDWIVSVLK